MQVPAVQHDLTTPRAQARAARLRAIEAEERREDQAALVTTPVRHARTTTSTPLTDTPTHPTGTMGTVTPLIRRRENGVYGS
jgi:hypothetical protein